MIFHNEDTKLHKKAFDRLSHYTEPQIYAQITPNVITLSSCHVFIQVKKVLVQS